MLDNDESSQSQSFWWTERKFYFALYKKNGLFLHVPFHIGFSKDHTHTQLHDASNSAAIHLKSQVSSLSLRSNSNNAMRNRPTIPTITLAVTCCKCAIIRAPATCVHSILTPVLRLGSFHPSRGSRPWSKLWDVVRSAMMGLTATTQSARRFD